MEISVRIRVKRLLRVGRLDHLAPATGWVDIMCGPSLVACERFHGKVGSKEDYGIYDRMVLINLAPYADSHNRDLQFKSLSDGFFEFDIAIMEPVK